MSEKIKKQWQGTSTLKLKWGITDAMARDVFITMTCKDKQDVWKLSNVCKSTAEGNFCDEHGRANKPATVQHHTQYIGCIYKGTAWLMSIQLFTEQGSRKINFFHLLEIILNNYTILTFCASKTDHRLSLTFTGNEDKGPLTSTLTKMRTNTTSQSNDSPWTSKHWT